MIKFEIEGKEYEIPEIMNVENYVKIFKIKDFFDDEYRAAKLINIVTNIPVDKLMDINFQQIQFLSGNIMRLFPKQKETFIDRFELDGIQYGFIPNWKEMSFAEYIDLDTLITKPQNEILDFLHVILAIMYRPIINDKKKHNFKIEKYNFDTVSERSELFKTKLDIKYFFGAQFFFINYGKMFFELSQLSSTLTPSIWMRWKIAWKYKTQLKNVLLNKYSGGMQSLIDLQMTMLLDMTQSLAYQSLQHSTKSPSLFKRIKNFLKDKKKR
jgi:hypothetical protein